MYDEAQLYGQRKGNDLDKVRTLQYELRMLLAGAGIDFSVFYKDKQIAHTKVNHMNEL